jgi:hypothetical protein
MDAHVMTQPPRIALILMVSGAVLTLYVAISLFADPFPEPTRQIAGALQIAIAIGMYVWLSIWRGMVKRIGPAADLSPVRLIIRGLVVAAFSVIIFSISFRVHLPDSIMGVAGALYFPLFLISITLRLAASKDEVSRYAVFESSAWGILVGLTFAYVSMFVVRFTPALSAWVQSVIESADTPPALAGFGFGVTFTIMVIWIAMVGAWVVWWRTRSR